MPGVRAAMAVRVSAEDPLGGLEVAERDPPAVPDGWTAVRVVAAAVNHHDLWTLKGVGVDPKRLPIVLGCDAAGIAEDGREVIVHAVIGTPEPGSQGGPGCDETLAPDFSLLSERHDGTMAELVAVPRRNLIRKPPELSFAEAACLPTAYLTAYRALFSRAGLQPGQRVLVQGAGGGVATAVAILGKATGLRVWVTSRSAERGQRAVAIGAERAFAAGARLPDRVHAVIDTVGQATWAHSLRSLLPGGTLVSIGATSGPNPPADLQRIFYRQLRIVGSTMGTATELADLVSLLVGTGARPVIDRVVPLADARSALGAMASGDLFGKIVLSL
ncbi:MAG TPA: zinc-binding dehydrogenase [Actinomycetota bacterium]|nr:zinc-binding dehydrogenase [Actinomycetota bacterium]